MNGRKQCIVVALGGNAILRRGETGTAEEQLKRLEITCRQLVDLITDGRYGLVITHGNGPQVGNILIQNETARELVPPMPLDVCGAESQGLIGYMLTQTLRNVLAEAGHGEIPIAALVTQTVVDRDDPAFQRPTKPVGPFYTQAKAKRLMAKAGYQMVEDADRGYRRVVPSPEPIAIVESPAIQRLTEARTVVIAVGGGGVPVVEEGGRWRGVEAVIDKDLASERLAEDLNAEILLLLTDVDHVMLNYNQLDEQPIDRMTIEQAKRYAAEGQFAEGSMKPKVEAAIRFIEAGGDRAIITSVERTVAAVAGETGTTIERERG
ncbi:MAG: carbamate kinase [Candidatus Bipolaricaulia bacterium]